MNHIVWEDGSEMHGYVPRIAGIGGGDYFEIEVCLDCKQLIGFDPDSVGEAQEAEKLKQEERDRRRGQAQAKSYRF